MRNSRRLAAGVCALAVLLQPALAQYRNAVPGYRFEFPRDYFNHPDFKTEWWYYTGNLTAKEGHHFGFELTFFRQAVNRHARQGEEASLTPWDVQDVYFAQLALSDLDAGHFYHTERLNRAGPGIAGASLENSRIWNGNWQIQWRDANQELQAAAHDFQLHLNLHPEKPPVLHGENGLSQKAPESGHASYYVSLTRLSATGELVLPHETLTVAGLAWMDHEFFTQQLQKDQVGWDWLSLQLNDNSELMLYRIRRRDGSFDRFSAGTYVNPEGKVMHLGADDFRLEPLGDPWTSPATHGTYPLVWKISVPKLNIELEARTKLPDQELATASSFVPSYWEGAIFLEGHRGPAKLGGVGYLEMTGYDSAVRLAP